jgi:hypothetical protein
MWAKKGETPGKEQKHAKEDIIRLVGIKLSIADV